MKSRTGYVVLVGLGVLGGIAYFFPPTTLSGEAAGCGAENNHDEDDIATSEIIGGTATSSTSYPWQVSLRTGGSAHTHMCGGAIISDRWVMTAAHCVTGVSNPEGIGVLAGSPNANRLRAADRTQTGELEGQYRTVDKIVAHPQFSNSAPAGLFYDVALLRVNAAFDFNDPGVGPVRISGPMDPNHGVLPVNSKVQVTGWGATTRDIGGAWATELQVVTMNFAGAFAGSGLPEGYLGKFTSLSAAPIAGTWYTDDGGAVVTGARVDANLVAVISQYVNEGRTLCTAADCPDLYSLLPNHWEWISATIKQVCVGADSTTDNDDDGVTGCSDSDCYSVCGRELLSKAIRVPAPPGGRGNAGVWTSPKRQIPLGATVYAELAVPVTTSPSPNIAIMFGGSKDGACVGHPVTTGTGKRVLACTAIAPPGQSKVKVIVFGKRGQAGHVLLRLPLEQ